MSEMNNDPFNLERFVIAQQGVLETAIGELTAGRKATHWMWFIFPQLRGLGRSPTAQFYGLESQEEARAYLAHSVLGPRLEQATLAVLSTGGLSVHQIFGSPDNLKFHSSMTLFDRAISTPRNPYQAALDRWFGGEADPATLALLAAPI